LKYVPLAVRVLRLERELAGAIARGLDLDDAPVALGRRVIAEVVEHIHPLVPELGEDALVAIARPDRMHWLDVVVYLPSAYTLCPRLSGPPRSRPAAGAWRGAASLPARGGPGGARWISGDWRRGARWPRAFAGDWRRAAA